MSNKLVKTNAQKNRSASGGEILSTILSGVIAVVGSLVVVLVPLYLKDGYYGVGNVKFGVYKWIMIFGMAVLALLTAAWFALKDQSEERGLTLTDKLVLAFLGFALFAAIAGGSFKECLMGYNGWFMGLFSLITFAVLYFFFAKFGRFYKPVLGILLGVTLIVCVIGILHRLLIDPIGTYEGIADKYKNQFLSTLGQATWYSSFVCTVLPLGIGVFYCGQKLWVRIAGCLFCLIGFCTTVTQNSDSAYMAVVGYMAVFLWFSMADVRKMTRFMEIVAVFLLAPLLMRLLFVLFPNDILELDSFSRFLIYHPVTVFLLVFAVLLCLVFRVLANKGIWSEKAAKLVRTVLYALLAAVVLAAALILILSAKGLLPEGIQRYTAGIPYMVWYDNWGNGRGRTWAFSWQMFRDMDIFHKLFGVGPDGYAPYAYSLYQERLVEMWGDRTLTNAHNEWMNGAISYGLIGGGAYIGIFLTSIRSFAEKCENQPILTGFIACIVSYMCHNFFCYQQVCCTPFVFMLMGIGAYLAGSGKDSVKNGGNRNEK